MLPPPRRAEGGEEGMSEIPMRGTLLNTATVLFGSLVGLGLGRVIPADWREVAIAGLGLITFGLGLRMFLEARNVLVVAAAVTLGGVLGAALGLDEALRRLAEALRARLAGGETFNEAFLTTSLLFCVGPMTVLGCLEDGLERKIDLLGVKSLLDGVASVFFAATLGAGVLLSAGTVLVVQGSLTLLASRLRGLAAREDLLRQSAAPGGAILMAIAIGLLELRDLDPELYLPAIAIGPALAALFPPRAKNSAGG